MGSIKINQEETKFLIQQIEYLIEQYEEDINWVLEPDTKEYLSTINTIKSLRNILTKIGNS